MKRYKISILYRMFIDSTYGMREWMSRACQSFKERACERNNIFSRTSSAHFSFGTQSSRWHVRMMLWGGRRLCAFFCWIIDTHRRTEEASFRVMRWIRNFYTKIDYKSTTAEKNRYGNIKKSQISHEIPAHSNLMISAELGGNKFLNSRQNTHIFESISWSRRKSWRRVKKIKLIETFCCSTSPETTSTKNFSSLLRQQQQFDIVTPWK